MNLIDSIIPYYIFAPMQSQEQEFIISKFKRHGQTINRKVLEKTIAWIRESSANSIDTLLKKLSQLALEGSNNIEENLMHSIQILSLNNKSLNSYDDLLEQTRKFSIFHLSPYEFNESTWFCPRPEKQLFEFRPEDRLRVSQAQFKRISHNNKQTQKQQILGVIYEDYSKIGYNGKSRLILQNEVNQIQLNLHSNFKPQCLLVSGCAYIVKGKYQSKDMSLTINQIRLPSQLPQDKNSTLKKKFKKMCENISSAKNCVGFQPLDFAKYGCVYTDPKQGKRPSLIFGNVTINVKTLERIRRIVDAYPQTISSLIILLSSSDHQPINLSVWFKNCKTFIVPHISSDGPHLLPKLPILKANIQSCTILTNPAKISYEGKQIMLVNYPLIKSIFSNVLNPDSVANMDQSELVSKISQLVYSQGQVAICQQYYWPQYEYFNISSQTVIIVNDSVAAMSFSKSKGKNGGMAISVNFDRDGDFLYLMSNSKNIVQFCQEPEY